MPPPPPLPPFHGPNLGPQVQQLLLAAAQVQGRPLQLSTLTTVTTGELCQGCGVAAGGPRGGGGQGAEG